MMDEDFNQPTEGPAKANLLASERFNLMQPDLAQRLKAFLDSLRPYSDVITSVSEITERLPTAYPPIFQRLCEIAPAIATGLERFSEDQAQKIQLLSENGWFPDFCTTTTDQLFKLNEQYFKTHTAEGPSQADSLMADHFEGVMSIFHDEAGSDFPNARLIIIQDAIKAHEEGRFNLSTPIFLMQADGYAAEVHKSPIWGIGNPNQRLFRKARENNDKGRLMGALVEPLLSSKLPMLASEKVRASEDHPAHVVNRHAVLHGESTDYGTRENSARAFSFMWYCMFFMDSLFSEVNT